MKVKEIIEGYNWDLTPIEFHHGRHADNTWRDEMTQPKEHLYILQDKKGKTIRSGLSHKAAVHLKDRVDLIKKYGQMRIVKVH